MKMELTKEARAEAVASLERYCEDEMGERIGNVAAEGLLRFFLEEIGPIIYNKAVADAQEKIQTRVIDMGGELYEEEFPYWRRVARQKSKK
jgi:uncharacterized protein (DUF2164 family)